MTTTKYELTDADRERLDAIAQRASGKPKVTDIAWKVASDWFASLPVVSREAVDRVLGEATEEEAERYDDDYLTHNDTSAESHCYALGRFLARRRAMLGDATVIEPPISEGERFKASPPAFALLGPQPSWDANARRETWAPANPELVASLRLKTASEPTPEPQPAIDVVAQLAEIRKAVDLMFSRQDAQRGVNKIHAERLDTLSFRVTALESAVQRKPWRWW